MKALKAKMARGLNVGSRIPTCDNSGAKMVQICSVRGHKTRRGRAQAGGISDLITIAVIKGEPGLQHQLFPAVIVRMRRPFRRADGTHIKFEDNAVVVCKDDKGNPKGTMIKGAIAKEVADRWPAIAKLAAIII